MSGRFYVRRGSIALGLFICVAGLAHLSAQVEPPEAPEAAEDHVPPALSTSDLPPIPGLEEYIVDRDMAAVLGKALFWDAQAGSDGYACASCHFHAGADSRTKNQLNPALLMGQSRFDRTKTGGGGPNYTLKKGDFPFHVKRDPLKKSSRPKNVRFDMNDVGSSQGVFRSAILGINHGPDEINDDKQPVSDPVFHCNGFNVRRVEPRNTPTTINAAFNHRNFWDGRANMIFNGVDPFGRRSNKEFPDGRLWRKGDNGTLEKVNIEILNSSLASQAVGPPLSDFEMSSAGRVFQDIGHKLITRRALRFQQVHWNDSSLASLVPASGPGLTKTYRELIEATFHPRWWDSAGTVDGVFTQMEANFSLFWGLAVQEYERELVSDMTPFDKFRNGDDSALTDSQKRGLDVFVGQGKCVNCHGTAAFTKASTMHLLDENAEEGLVERMFMSDHRGGPGLYDNGFYNIGVRPTGEDIGVGANDPFGTPLSFTKQYVLKLLGRDVPDPFEIDPCKFEVPWVAADFPVANASGNLTLLNCNGHEGAFDTVAPNVPKGPKKRLQRREIRRLRVAVRGAFKVPSLRNIELTGPYMHNGGMSTLEQVVEFYNRGGDFSDKNRRNLDTDITSLGLSDQQQADLVAFMKALTDPRVANECGPFDHPELVIPSGHPGDHNLLDCVDGIEGCDESIKIPAVGDGGLPAEGLPPIKPFEELLQD